MFGCGGLAKEVTLLVEDINDAGEPKFNIAGYVVPTREDKTFLGKPVVAEDDFLQGLDKEDSTGVVLAVGDPAVRRTIVDKLNNYGITYPRLIHPSAKLHSFVSVGEGSVICSDVIFSMDIVIGSHCYINLRCSFGHDVQIGDFVQISPHSLINGNTKIGDDCMIGAASTIYPGVKIGPSCTVGIGSVVLKDVPEATTVFGNPARKLR